MVLALSTRAFCNGLSGHAPKPFETDFCMTEQGAKRYRAEIARLREKYRGKIGFIAGSNRIIFECVHR